MAGSDDLAVGEAAPRIFTPGWAHAFISRRALVPDRNIRAALVRFRFCVPCR